MSLPPAGLWAKLKIIPAPSLSHPWVTITIILWKCVQPFRLPFLPLTWPDAQGRMAYITFGKPVAGSHLDPSGSLYTPAPSALQPWRKCSGLFPILGAQICRMLCCSPKQTHSIAIYLWSRCPWRTRPSPTCLQSGDLLPGPGYVAVFWVWTVRKDF